MSAMLARRHLFPPISEGPLPCRRRSLVRFTPSKGVTPPSIPPFKRREEIAFGLRTSTGVSESKIASWPEEVASLLSEGYLEEAGNRVRLTPKGRMVADSVAELFV